MALNYVTVTGTFDDGSGSPIPAPGQTAYCLFTPSTQVFASGVPLITPAQPIQAAISNGALSQRLLATDNTGLSFGGLTGFFFWTVQVIINGQAQAPWSFFLPHTPTTVDLSALANTAAGSSGFANPMTTLGDLMFENATPAAARLAGNTSAAKQFLTQTGTGSVSAAPAWGPIAAGDLPAATTSVQGAVVLDGTAADIQPLGVQAAGAVGKAADAGHIHPYPPYQFTPEAYGAKRNGAFLYDVKMTNGSAVLTTAGLPAPATPTLSNSGSGGSLTAGTYQVEVTYVNQFGETLASSAASIAISGTQPLTVTSPLPWTNATGYYVYCTQAGGSSFTRQQSPGSPTPLRTSYVLSANPSSGGAAPPGANTSNSAPFTANDVGKAIVVPSAAGFLNGALNTTIASYQSATQVTLAANCTTSAGVTSYGAMYGTDDTAAIQAAVNAAVAYAQSTGKEQALGEVVFSNGIYVVAGALTGTYQQAQITIPYIDSYVGPQVHLKLTGPQDATGPAHWEQPNPPASGAVLASTYYSDNTPAVPYPVVIGGPVTSPGVSNMRVIVDGINVLVPYRCSISGLDLYAVGQADIKSFSYFGMARTSTAAGGWPPYMSGGSNPSPWQCFGYRTPTTGNNALNDLNRLTSYGPYHAVVFADHFAAHSIRAVNCYAAATTGPVGSNTSHHCVINSLMSELTQVVLYNPNDGVMSNGGSQAVTILSAHVENAGFYVQDPNSALYGEMRAESLGTTGVVTNGKSGALNYRLVWDFQTLGAVASPPAVPATTVAYTNQFWRDAVVIVTGGTVSAIAVDGKTTGLTSGPVFVRNGGTITLTYSSAPTWAWVLA